MSKSKLSKKKWFCKHCNLELIYETDVLYTKSIRCPNCNRIMKEVEIEELLETNDD